jgi:hypothetical protein
MFSVKKIVAGSCLAAVTSVGMGLAALPAQSAPVVTGGLVNVTITDVLSHDQINAQIPIGVAANVCGVAANVLAERTSSAPVDCTSATTQQLPVAFRRGL